MDLLIFGALISNFQMEKPSLLAYIRYITLILLSTFNKTWILKQLKKTRYQIYGTYSRVFLILLVISRKVAKIDISFLRFLFLCNLKNNILFFTIIRFNFFNICLSCNINFYGWCYNISSIMLLVIMFFLFLTFIINFFS